MAMLWSIRRQPNANAPFLQPMAVSAASTTPTVPLMAASVPSSFAPVTPPAPARPVVAATQMADWPAPDVPKLPTPTVEVMANPQVEGTTDLKRPHETASHDSATPTKKTFSNPPATPASESSAIQTENTVTGCYWLRLKRSRHSLQLLLRVKKKPSRLCKQH